MKPSRKFTVVIEQDEEGYLVATVPALRGCHTQAKSLDTLMKRIREVTSLCLEEDGNPPGAKGKELVRALERAGLTVDRSRGSHLFLRHPDGRTTTVPIHSGETIGPGLLRAILRDVELSVDELADLL
jgi:predicted RNA binding protein YcfA (HicA-like mRNA interferase family)